MYIKNQFLNILSITSFTKYKRLICNFQIANRAFTTNEDELKTSPPIIKYLDHFQTTITHTVRSDGLTIVGLQDLSGINNIYTPEIQNYTFFFEYLPTDRNLISIYLKPFAQNSHPVLLAKEFATVQELRRELKFIKKKDKENLANLGFNSKYFAFSVTTDECAHELYNSLDTPYLAAHEIICQGSPVLGVLNDMDTLEIIEQIKEYKNPSVIAPGFGVVFAQHSLCVDIVRYKPALARVKDLSLIEKSGEGNEIEGVAITIGIFPFLDDVAIRPSTILEGFNLLVGKAPFPTQTMFGFDPTIKLYGGGK
jgi:hypothetical protein